MGGQIFLSQANADLAENLCVLIRDAFPGMLEIFNSAKASSGLAAGESIEQGIVGRIQKSEIIIWLATPISVEKSFWMAWELGVAVALGKSIFPCVALGLSPDQLPLFQSGKIAPDLGSADALEGLLMDIGNSLSLDVSKVAGAVERAAKNRSHALFKSREEVEILSIRLAGERLILENRSDNLLKNLTYEGVNASVRQSLSKIINLEPRQRRIIPLNEAAKQHVTAEPTALRVSWIDPKLGRCHQDIDLKVMN